MGEMQQRVRRRAFIVVLGILLTAALGLTYAAAQSLETLADSTWSVRLGLLGPIDEVGRNGWDCEPERAAKARAIRDADLPNPSGP